MFFSERDQELGTLTRTALSGLLSITANEANQITRLVAIVVEI